MTTIAQDLGGVVRLLEDMTPGDLIVYDANEGDGWPPRPLWCFKNEAYDSGEEPALQGGIHYGGKEDADAIAAAVNFLRTNSAEIAWALEQLRDLHDSIRTVYDAVPALPITADTMDAATNALHAFCLLVGIHRVDVGGPQPQPAMQQGGGGGE